MPAPVPPNATKKSDVRDTYFGVTVDDPYRWLEDADSEDTRAFVDRENARMRAYVDALPGRDALSRRIAELLSLGMTSVPAVRVGAKGERRYFHVKRSGAQNQPVLSVRDGAFGLDRVLIDPAALSDDATTALDWWYPSRSGELVAWGRSESGSEESTLLVRDVASGRDLDLAIPHTRHATVAWLPDQSGFYYTRFPTPGSVPAGEEKYGCRVYFHELGKDPATDALVFGDGRDKTDVPGVGLSPNGRYLVVSMHQGWDKSEVYVLDREAPSAGFVMFAGGERVLYGAIPRDDLLYLHTNDGASRYALFAAPYDAKARAAWREIIAEGADVLEDVVVTDREILATYLQDAASRVERFTLTGKSKGAVALPALGTASVSAPLDGTEAFVSFTSFVVPPEVFRLDLEREGAELVLWERAGEGVARPDVDVTRMVATSKDGTRVPMFVVAKKGLVRDGQRPTVLYGYGGFNVNQTPAFSSRALTLVENDGVWVSAVLRGGGELGEAWHKAGMLDRKQNVFDDFYACAETLVSAGVTSPEKLAAMGGSNGGLLVAVAVTQRPALFRVGLSLVPLTDMLRYHHFRIGKLWVPEYGSADDEAGFRTLFAYSPYHRVQDGARYPSMLFTTAESDSRVDPLHARKMAARMQAAQGNADHPILLRVETKAGHGAGKPISKVATDITDEIAFVLHELSRP